MVTKTKMTSINMHSWWLHTSTKNNVSIRKWKMTRSSDLVVDKDDLDFEEWTWTGLSVSVDSTSELLQRPFHVQTQRLFNHSVNFFGVVEPLLLHLARTAFVHCWITSCWATTLASLVTGQCTTSLSCSNLQHWCLSDHKEKANLTAQAECLYAGDRLCHW